MMPKPNTGIIQSWRSAPCGGCGRRKGENEIKALRKTVVTGIKFATIIVVVV